MEVVTTSIATPKGPAGGHRFARPQVPRALQPEGVGDPAALSATRHKARQRLARSSGAPEVHNTGRAHGWLSANQYDRYNDETGGNPSATGGR